MPALLQPIAKKAITDQMDDLGLYQLFMELKPIVDLHRVEPAEHRIDQASDSLADNRTQYDGLSLTIKRIRHRTTN